MYFFQFSHSNFWLGRKREIDVLQAGKGEAHAYAFSCHIRLQIISPRKRVDIWDTRLERFHL